MSDLPAEKKTNKENAAVGGPDSGSDGEAGNADSSGQNDGRPSATDRGYVPVQGAKPKRHLTAEDVLNQIGDEFLVTYPQDTGKAWSQLMLQLMRHLALLTRSGVITNLKDILAVARDVEEHIRKTIAVGGGQDGELRLPMDEIGQKWRVEVPQSDESVETPTQTKKRSRQKTESASKSTISSASPSSNGKTNSETNGSVP